MMTLLILAPWAMIIVHALWAEADNERWRKEIEEEIKELDEGLPF